MQRTNHQRRYSSLPVLSWLENEMRRARRAVARSQKRLSEVNRPDLADDNVARRAGDALRGAELEAAETEKSTPSARESDQQICGMVYREALEQLSIDDLRELAFDLQIPDRSTITEKAALIDEICKRL